jgi:integrase/recombinase XerC
MSRNGFQKLGADFQKALEKQNKHPNTIRSYGNDLKQFATWCVNTFGEDVDPGELTRSDVQDFRAFLLTRNSSPASVNRKITALRQFFEFCVQEGVMKGNPAAEISGVAAEPRAPSYLERKDALLLARTAERMPNPMDASIILLLLHSGLRSSEICTLSIGDLHLTPREGRLFIKGQRGKTTRFVYLSSRTQNALRKYMRLRGITVLSKKHRREALFPNFDGMPLTQQSVDQIVKRIGKLAGIPFVTPSMLRNTYAAQALASGKSADSVARDMGVVSTKSIARLKDLLDGDTSE